MYIYVQLKFYIIFHIYTYMYKHSGSPRAYKAGWCARQVVRIPYWWELTSSKQRCPGTAGLSGPNMIFSCSMRTCTCIFIHVHMQFMCTFCFSPRANCGVCCGLPLLPLCWYFCFLWNCQVRTPSILTLTSNSQDPLFHNPTLSSLPLPITLVSHLYVYTCIYMYLYLLVTHHARSPRTPSCPVSFFSLIIYTPPPPPPSLSLAVS